MARRFAPKVFVGGTSNIWTANQTYKDCVKIFFGTGKDASIFYNGSNLLLKANDVGCGKLILQSELCLSIGRIVFPCSSNYTTNSLTLDEYREGSLTPGIADDNGSGCECQTYTTRSGHYTRIGDRIFFNLRLDVTSLGCLTTCQAARVIGLPFTSINFLGGGFHSVSIGFATGLNIGAGDYITGYIGPNEDFIRLQRFDTTGGSTALLLSEFSCDGDIIISGQYEAAD